MDIVCYEHDQGFVLERFREGEFDYLDAASEVFETEFFRYIGGKKILEEAAGSYPTPRKKEEVPVWFYVASNLSMRMHGVHRFNAYPFVVRCGGMLNAFGPEIAHKARAPSSEDVTLSCQGFNEKNTYDRETPCDQDFLRKLAKDTDAEQLMKWMNQDVAKVFKKHKAFDEEGIFIGDGSYIFVPDNPAYEGSVRMLFDEHNHPVEAESLKGMSPQKAAKCQWRRCYKMVSLLHTDRENSFFFRLALKILPGNAHECPVMFDLLEDFIAAVGPGVVKRLILDRGFLDGAKIGQCKQKHGMDVLIPLKKNMDLYQDALGLLQCPDVQFQTVPPASKAPPAFLKAPEVIRRKEMKRQKTLAEKKENQPKIPPEKILLRSEVCGLSELTSFETCPIPLNVIVNRETYGDGHQDLWMLLDTDPKGSLTPLTSRQEYHLRMAIEEGHRQLKCFWDLTQFTSRSFSLIANQIVFVALAYNLLQLYLKRNGRQELNQKSRPRIKNQLLPNDSFIIVYCQNRFALFSTYQYTELLLTLSKDIQTKILNRTRRIQRELTEQLRFPRPP